MAQRKEIMVNGQLTPVWQTDSTAQQIDDTVKTTRYQCNPNLLDNWCFLPGCVVNQRGQTSYSAIGYTIDRWKLDIGTGVNISDCLTLNTSGSYIGQYFDESFNTFKGMTLTGSVLLSNGHLQTGHITYNGVINQGQNFFSSQDDGLSMYVHAIVNTLIQVEINTLKDNVAIIAVKLELGDQQTLAHQDADGNWVLNEIPNYAEQLARCQRYQRFVSRGTLCQIVNNASIVVKVPFEQPMRATPVITVVNSEFDICYAAGWFPRPTGPITVASASATQYGIAYIHLGGWDFSSGSVSLPPEFFGTLATDNVILLDANL